MGSATLSPKLEAEPIDSAGVKLDTRKAEQSKAKQSKARQSDAQ
jgi:hypothetical protein